MHRVGLITSSRSVGWGLSCAVAELCQLRLDRSGGSVLISCGEQVKHRAPEYGQNGASLRHRGWAVALMGGLG